MGSWIRRQIASQQRIYIYHDAGNFLYKHNIPMELTYLLEWDYFFFVIYILFGRSALVHT